MCRWVRRTWKSLCGVVPAGSCRGRVSRIARCSGFSAPRCARVGPIGEGHEVLCPLVPRHTARRRLRRAVCEGVGSRGSLEPDAMAQRALRTPSPLLLRRERVRWGTAVGSAPEAIDTVVKQGGGGWRLSYFVPVVLFYRPRGYPEAIAVYSRSRAQARHPPCFSWRSGPTQSQLGASSLAYRCTAIMRRGFLWSGPPGPSAQAFVGLGEGGNPASIFSPFGWSAPGDRLRARPGNIRHRPCATWCGALCASRGLTRLRQPPRASRQTEPR